jgi:Rod binding domain-containing protein
MTLPPISGSSSTVSGATGAPAIDQALEPAWVRRGSTATQQAYASALAFEETLVEQLSQSLASTSGLGGESAEGGASSEEGGSTGSGANSSPISSMLPQALAAGVMHAGGLGLAAQLTHELETAGSASQAQSSGGTAPTVGAAGATPASDAPTTQPASGGTDA